MSYILDALKQSERRRNRQAPIVKPPVSPETLPAAPRPFYRRRLLWVLLMLILAVPLGIGLGRFGAGWLGLSPASAPQPARPPEAASPNSPRIQVEESPARSPIIIGSNSPRILVEEPPAVSLNEPEPKPEPKSKPASSRPERAAATAPSNAAPPAELAFDPGVPDLRELPASIRNRLPELTLSVHIYSPDPAARMANINGQMLREGQNVGPLSIERITPKGVILRFQGNNFHLYSVGG